MTVRILHGDVRAVLPTLPDRSVQMCVTSPPYWALRSYLPADHADKALEIGSEPTVDEWVDTMVAVFREVRRVLKDNGVLFLNLGDSYSSNAGGYDATGSRGVTSNPRIGAGTMAAIPKDRKRISGASLKPKDLIGQPWMVAFALRADGWWLRQEIIWHKPGPMPESTRDRCTKAHEHVFLLTKSERYFWDFDAVQEPVSGTANARGPRASIKQPDGWDTGTGAHGSVHREGRQKGATVPDPNVGRRYYKGNGVGFGHGYDANPKPRVMSGNGAYADGASGRMGRSAGWRSELTPKAEAGLAHGGHAEGKSARMESVANGALVETRNPRSVWTIPAEPFRGSHYATYPTELARRCIVAGSREGDTVLDPFMGSGTTGIASDRLGRDCIGIDLDERNVPMAEKRLASDAGHVSRTLGLFAEGA